MQYLTYNLAPAEYYIYGSSRLGMIKHYTANDGTVHTLEQGKKQYELADHLGNVRTTFSDRKLVDDNVYKTDLISSMDYYPFGAPMQHRFENYEPMAEGIFETIALETTLSYETAVLDEPGYGANATTMVHNGSAITGANLNQYWKARGRYLAANSGQASNYQGMYNGTDYSASSTNGILEKTGDGAEVHFLSYQSSGDNQIALFHEINSTNYPDLDADGAGDDKIIVTAVVGLNNAVSDQGVFVLLDANYQVLDFENINSANLTGTQVTLEATDIGTGPYYVALVAQVHNPKQTAWHSTVFVKNWHLTIQDQISTEEIFVDQNVFAYQPKYRYGFNGMERDDEMKGIGNSYDFGARLYDPRLGRWFSEDPKFYLYKSYSPYHFGYDNPIITIDGDGRENIVVIGNATDPGDPHPHPAGRQLLLTGLSIANDLQNQSDKMGDSEGTMILIYRGHYKDYELNEFVAKLENSKNVQYKVVDSKDEIMDYISDKNGEKDPRSEDLVTDFAYVGHANSQELRVGHGVYNWEEEQETLEASDFSSESFSPLSNAYLYGCRTGNEDGGRTNIAQDFANNLVGGQSVGSPHNIVFGYSSFGVVGGAGTFMFNNASFPNTVTGNVSPNVYPGKGQQVAKMKTLQVQKVE